MNIPHIEHALDHITTACEKRLSSLYPKGIPTPVNKRYQQEPQYLSHSELIDDFELFHQLSLEAQKSANFIITSGTTAGSFIYYLLGNNCFNPLPAYYYCSHCGYYEEISTHLFGIDLPGKQCPHCRKDMEADGFHLSAESVWAKWRSFHFIRTSDKL